MNRDTPMPYRRGKSTRGLEGVFTIGGSTPTLWVSALKNETFETREAYRSQASYACFPLGRRIFELLPQSDGVGATPGHDFPSSPYYGITPPTTTLQSRSSVRLRLYRLLLFTRIGSLMCLLHVTKGLYEEKYRFENHDILATL